jgi:ligand-binding sensor domain-containing protein/signal transduction histidine kinase
MPYPYGVLILLMSAVLIRAQPQYEFEHISIEHGLSQTSVNDIFQDHKGFLWFGTQDGLNRYDGYTLKIYKNQPFDETTLPHNWINTLAEDSDGNIWIGMASGLSIYDRRSDTFGIFTHGSDSLPVFTNKRITKILIDAAGLIWIGTRFHGLYQYNPRSKTLKRFLTDRDDPTSLSDNNIISIYQDLSQRIWIGTFGGLNGFNSADSSFKRYRHADGDPFSVADDQIQAMIEGPANHFWIGTYSGLSRFYPETGKFENNLFQIQEQSLLSSLIQCFLYDQDSCLWIGSAGGLHLFDPPAGRFYTYLNQPHNPTSLSDDNIFSLIQDRSGLIWIGTLRRGVNKLNKLKSRFHNIHKTPFSYPGLNNDFVYAFLQDVDSTLWIGTDGGLNRYDRKTGTFTYYDMLPQYPNSIFIRAIHRDRQGNLWLGTRGGGLIAWHAGYLNSIRFQHFLFSAENPEGLSSNHVFCILEDRDGILWFGTSNGLCTLDPQHKSKGLFTVYKNVPEDTTTLPVNNIRALHEGRDGAIWIGTYGGGLCRYDKINQTLRIYRHKLTDPNSLSNDFIYSILEDSQGTLWVGTYGGGLNALSPADRNAGIFRHYYTEHGLPANLIYGILEDNTQNLWVSTTRGLASCDINLLAKNHRSEELLFRQYDASNGVQSTEFNAGAYYRNEKGELFFGGINGFTFFNPRNLYPNTSIPSISITDFKIFNQSIPIRNNARQRQNVTEAAEIRLNYSQNIITIEFAALDFNAPSKNLYTCRMEGFDRNWMKLPPGQHSVTYTNLDPGTYLFRVKGSNSDGNWNNQAAELKLAITPPFWMSHWFRFILAIGAAALLIFIYRTRIINIQKQKLKLETEVEQRTRELRYKTEQLEAANYELESFSYSVSHDLRGPLRSISGFSRLVMEELDPAAHPGIHAHLQRIHKSTLHMSDLINALLILSRVTRSEMHKSKLPLSTMTHSILNELQQSEPARKSDFQIEPDLWATGDETLIKTLLQNLLGNAWKFSSKQEISCIAFGLTPGKMPADKNKVYYIRDNGAGFDMNYYDKLFKPFQRLHSHAEFSGTGIGLATVKRIINRHGGQIWAESRIDQGATFFFTLP